MTKRDSAGTTISYGAAFGTGLPLPAAETFAILGQVDTISGPNFSKAEIDVTDLDSVAKEFLADLPDPGQVEIEVYLDGANVGHQTMFADGGAITRQRNFRLTLNDDTVVADRTTLDFVAEVIDTGLSFERGDAQRMSLTLRVSGGITPTWTAD